MRFRLTTFLLLLALVASAQQEWLNARSTLRHKLVDFTRDTLVLDSFPILKKTVQLIDYQGNTIDTAYYKIEQKQLILTKIPLALRQQNARCSYRILPFRLEAATAHKDTAWFLGGQRAPREWYAYVAQRDAARGVLEAKGLDYSGSLTRGISVGNTQDLVVNSQFNLQLGGKIGDDIEIKGAISDQNIPLQPDGNTQRLQQFDKVFLQIKRKQTALNIGDYELQRPSSYFINYFRRLQGVMLETKFGNSRADSSQRVGAGQVQAAAAVARGKFVRNTIAPLEGNQGPYKLRGNNGERFLIVLANTERVYLDGRLLTRGVDNDYIINYNSGELIFTAKQLITKDKRIVVEFSYTDQNFLRFVTAVNADYKTDRFTAHFHLYNEGDNKNSPQQSILSDTSVQRKLSTIGDSLQFAFFSGARLDSAYNPKTIQYFSHDTLVANTIFTIYSVNVLFKNNEKKLYSLSFTELGQGRGNYALKTNSTANGRVYEWVAPDPVTGKSRGAYEPVIQLITPKSQQIYAAGFDYELTKHLLVQTEVSLSNKDNNLFSERDKSDNTGLAARLNLAGAWKLDNSQQRRTAQLTTKANYEYLQASFNPLDAYRPIEFTRDWNTNTINAATTSLKNMDEHLLGLDVLYKTIQQKKLIISSKRDSSTSSKKPFLGAPARTPSVFSINYSVSSFIKLESYQGIKNGFSLSFQTNNWLIKSNATYLVSKGSTEKTNFIRPNLDISKVFGRSNQLQIGLYGEAEQNLRRSIKSVKSDSLQGGSQQYYFYKAYFQNTDSAALQWNVSYQRRKDWAKPILGDFAQLKEATLADDATLSGVWNLKKTQQIRLNFTYRALQILDSTLTDTKKPQDTYLGKFNYVGRWLENALVLQSVYELGNGQEQRVEYTYIEVPAGQGQYAWFDRNNNGTRELNEFEVSAFQDQAKYVRLNTFTGKYVRSNLANATQTLSITPSNFWRTPTSQTAEFLSRFSSVSSVQIIRKTLDSPEIQAYNPYQLNIADSNLVSNSSVIRNAVYFNRLSNSWGIDWIWQDNFSKQILTSGSDSRRRSEHLLRARYNPSSDWNITSDLSTGQKSATSQLFQDRAYTVQYYTASPKLTWLHRQTWRIATSYLYAQNQNQIGNREQAVSHNLTAEMVYSSKSGSALTAKCSVVNMNFTGEPNSPVGFALLEGLQNGQNLLWSVAWDKKLTKNLQLSLSYDGRKTGSNAPTVHVGRMQVRAIF